MQYSNTIDFSKAYNRFMLWFLMPFTLLFIVSFSFPHQIIPDVGYYFSGLFKPLALFTATYLFGVQNPVPELISDSALLYANTFNLILLSGVFSLLFNRFYNNTTYYNHIFYWFVVAMRYYLALQLFVYGFNKIFKWQFYVPEPNTLFTTVGDSYKDILYWSSMGSSWWYTFFSGLIEVIAGVLILFQRTLILGGLLSIAIMLNVFMINIGFDISVKLYSLFLLMVSFIILIPYNKKIVQFFFHHQQIDHSYAGRISTGMSLNTYRIVKTIVVLWLMADSTFIYFSTGNFNDDKAQRPPFHGAYEVETFVENNDTIPPLNNHWARWKRIFIHSRGYFIVQYMDDKMQDFEIKTDTLKKNWLLRYNNTNLNTQYNQINDSTIYFQGRFDNRKIQAKLKKLNLKKLRLLQEEFSWTIDSK